MGTVSGRTRSARANFSTATCVILIHRTRYQERWWHQQTPPGSIGIFCLRLLVRWPKAVLRERSASCRCKSAPSDLFARGEIRKAHGRDPSSTLRSRCFFHQIAIEDLAEICQFRFQRLHGRQTAFGRSSAESLTDKSIVAQKAKGIGFLVE